MVPELSLALPLSLHRARISPELKSQEWSYNEETSSALLLIRQTLLAHLPEVINAILADRHISPADALISAVKSPYERSFYPDFDNPEPDDQPAVKNLAQAIDKVRGRYYLLAVDSPRPKQDSAPPAEKKPQTLSGLKSLKSLGSLSAPAKAESLSDLLRPFFVGPDTPKLRVLDSYLAEAAKSDAKVEAETRELKNAIYHLGLQVSNLEYKYRRETEIGSLLQRASGEEARAAWQKSKQAFVESVTENNAPMGLYLMKDVLIVLDQWKRDIHHANLTPDGLQIIMPQTPPPTPNTHAFLSCRRVGGEGYNVPHYLPEHLPFASMVASYLFDQRAPRAETKP